MPLLELATVLLLAAVVLVPVFQRLRLGAVVGYLAAGMLLGPWGLGVVADAEKTLGFAELGVALLLFLVGLELDVARLWSLRGRVFGMGAAQVAVTGFVVALLASALGVTWHAALVAGFGAGMSSTALVLATFAERGDTDTQHGRAAFAVLLFQDLAVIPLLALLPLLAYASPKPAVSWMAAVKMIGAIAAFIVLGRIVLRPLLKALARYSTGEIFTAAALLVVAAAALAMERLGLSISFGAFLAGLLLADSEFRHELRADIEPFKGLLMGLFFMSVGMGANLTLLSERPVALVSLAVALMAVKFVLMYPIARIARMDSGESARVAVALAQGGEFAFVLFGAALTAGILAPQLADVLVLIVTISMVLAGPAMTLHEKLLSRWLERRAEPEYDAIDAAANPVIIAGFGRFGQIVARVLRMCDIPFTALDSSYTQVDFVRRFGNRIYYGDASRLELLRASKAAEAKLFVLAIDDVEASMRTAAIVRRHFPKLEILARAHNRVHYFRLRDLGVRMIYRETFPASLEVARDALQRLGFGPPAAERAVKFFEQHDIAQLDAQYAVHQDEEQLVQTTREAAAQLRELFEADLARARRGPIAKREGQAVRAGD